ncbi:MAG: hypothetical protein H6606_06035 [Flavobacteriales bacterium]|nr:hypothetical protein [Flavobacteriales bacterium]
MKQELKNIAQELLKVNNLERIYMTEDGQGFAREDDARNYAAMKKLGKPELFGKALETADVAEGAEGLQEAYEELEAAYVQEQAKVAELEKEVEQLKALLAESAQPSSGQKEDQNSNTGKAKAK